MTRCRMKRIFVVGMPRTGTTLVQSLIATNQEVFSTYETHYLNAMAALFKSDVGFLDILFANIRGYRILKNLPLEGGYAWVSSSEGSIRMLDKAMTCSAKKLKKTAFLEKTPNHLYYTDKILEVLPDSKIIFVIRNAEDTVSSYLKAAKNWGKGSHELGEDFVFARWLMDTSLCIEKSKQRDGLLVDYDRLTNLDDFKSEVEKIESYVGLSLNLDASSLKLSSSRIITSNETWKSNNLNGGIIFRKKTSPNRRFSELASTILERIKDKL